MQLLTALKQRGISARLVPMHALVHRWPIAPQHMKAYGVSRSRGEIHRTAMSGPDRPVVRRGLVLEGFPESSPLRGRAPGFESPDNQSGLSTQGARARRRAEARVRAQPVPGIHHEVNVPLYGGSVDVLDISGVHRSALIDHIGDRRQKAINIPLARGGLRLLTITGCQCARAADHNCECTVAHGRESLASNNSREENGGEDVTACFIRPRLR